jgi:hypothetical protein
VRSVPRSQMARIEEEHGVGRSYALAVPSFALIWSSGAGGQPHPDVKAITEAYRAGDLRLGLRVDRSATAKPIQ